MKTVSAAIAMGLLTVASLASAGDTYGPGTIINTSTSKYGQGSLSGTRYSSDTTEYIGCSAFAYPSGADTSAASTAGECYAQDSSGNYVSCLTYAPNAIDLIQGINSATFVSFQVDTSGYCSSIAIENTSLAIH